MIIFCSGQLALADSMNMHCWDKNSGTGIKAIAGNGISHLKVISFSTAENALIVTYFHFIKHHSG